MKNCRWPSFAIVVLVSACGTLATAAETEEFATGTAFRKALEQPVSGLWGGSDANLRTILRALAEARHVAVLTDRRIDPTANRTATAGGEPLGDFLEHFAVDLCAGTAVVGNTVYLGPPAAAARLRTLVALRTQKLLDDSAIPVSRRIELRQERDFRWDDLTRPADVLKKLSEEYGIAIEGLELIPHDLWGAAVLPEANVIEALSLVLIQFNLTFEWIDRGRGVRIEEAPEHVVIERVHQPPKGMSANAAAADWRERLPGLEARVEKGKVVVCGTEELHELVERLRRGGTIPDQSASNSGPPRKLLKFERYTLHMKNTPASALMKELEKPAQGELVFEYDPEELKAAGINLDKLISVEVKNAPIEELLKATFESLGLAFAIVNRTVKLKPVKPQ